ncbi:nucleotidyl transferase AbiEii/AbiGii toxin family protein [Deinococcus roseus]|uniref:Nucleotidyl transferase AbiEii/AbiGii toxin family protein n=1 Tax=Deinococcus roseus TaxID=392414 RepID=A0ABQ2DII3_9DEIO|nr:nucleotidyl transferase AbiEii/AbiGii toxin family protein [Deinococcus roseus]GGJ59280.1 hypothetical protein GCM10008938_51760 [Deinococcus roseus]
MTSTPDPSVSLLAKLRNLALKLGLSRETMLLLYAQQGLLARIALSPHQDDFVLKGGLSLFARYVQAARPTQDIDLAARHLPNTPEGVKQALEIALKESLPDQVTFDTENMRLSTLHEEADYPGVRVLVDAVCGRARITLQLDVSFGNTITPGPIMVDFPQLLIPQPAQIRIYPLETVVAEKFAALLELGRATTRMKDLYDLHTILQRETFELAMLQQAIERAFLNRGTLREAHLEVFSTEFWGDPALQGRWQLFLRRTRLDAPQDLRTLMQTLAEFLQPTLGPSAEKTWVPEAGQWQHPVP